MCKASIVVTFTLLVLLATLPTQSNLPIYKTIDLGVGESITIGELLRVGFDGIPADSRCPEGALCFWEGNAIAKMWVEQPLTERVNFELHTHRGFPWQFTYGNYRITLVGVAPYPKIDERIDPNDYIASILVTDVSTPVEMTSWGRIKALYE
jgi:hypothetical protein